MRYREIAESVGKRRPARQPALASGDSTVREAMRVPGAGGRRRFVDQNRLLVEPENRERLSAWDLADRNFSAHRLYGDWPTVNALWNSIVRTVAEVSEFPVERLGAFMDSSMAQTLLAEAIARNIRSHGGWTIEEALKDVLEGYGGRNIARRAQEKDSIRRQQRANETVEETMRVPGAGGRRRAPMRKPLLIEPNNRQFGFWGSATIFRNGIEEVTDEPVWSVDDLWNAAITLVVAFAQCTPEQARDFLDSRSGRHLMDAVTGYFDPEDIEDSVRAGIHLDYGTDGRKLRSAVFKVAREMQED